MKALKLAEAAETTMRPGGLADEVARELRRLAEVNAELVEALIAADLSLEVEGYMEEGPTRMVIRAAIAKAKE